MLCEYIYLHMGNCQNYGPFLGPYYNTGPNTGPNLGDPKRDHNFDNPPHTHCRGKTAERWGLALSRIQALKASPVGAYKVFLCLGFRFIVPFK